MEEKELDNQNNSEEAAVTGGGFIYPKLDYTITDPQERNKKVYEIVNSVPREKLTPYYLEQLGRYLTETPQIKKKNKKQRMFLTENRMVTVNERETSLEGLVDKFENGEDGVYNLMTQGDKNILLVNKPKITKKDLQTIPGLKELSDEIQKVMEWKNNAVGRKKFLLIQQLKQMRQDRIVLKNDYLQPISIMKVTKSANQINLYEDITINENGQPVSNGLVSLFNPDHICCLLCNYSKLKEECYGHFDSDFYYLMEDLDNAVDSALKDKYPILYEILILKIDGMQNKDIAQKLKDDFGVTYSIEYLSSVWRKKIPKLIAEQAKEDWIVWHYTFQEKGKWKRCSRCHEIKLAHPYFYSKNNTAKDGWYSMCKCCRNKKNKDNFL